MGGTVEDKSEIEKAGQNPIFSYNQTDLVKNRVADSGDALMIDGVYHQEYIWCKLHPKPVAKSKHDFCFQWREQGIDERKVAP